MLAVKDGTEPPPFCENPATAKLLLSCVVRVTLGVVLLPEFVAVVPMATTPLNSEVVSTNPSNEPPVQLIVIDVFV